VIWVGEALENYLEKPLSSLAGKARVLEIADISELTLLDVREGGAFDAHDDHPAAKPGKTRDPKGHIHADDEKDMHLWLDPDNARVIVARIAAELTKIDPDNAMVYRANAAKMNERLTALERGIKERLAPVQDRPYLVFHDAYQYFERHFGTKIVGSITVSPDQAPGAKRVAELRDRIRTSAPACVFREPQFPAPIVDTLVGGTNVRIGVLDPEGANMTPGANAYFTLMDRIADSLATCLAPSS
jgi:zinc transport system substrate-binding protein